MLTLGSGLGSSATFTNPNQVFNISNSDQSLWLINGRSSSPLESPGGSLSKLDLKAPGKARHEYDKGYQLLQRKDLQGAVEHLTAATSIYTSYVAAHNALGSAYLALGQNDKARAEFAQAITLDDHLPTSYLNLGCAELALSHYPAAEEAIQKASNIAPLDLQLLTRWLMDNNEPRLCGRDRHRPPGASAPTRWRCHGPLLCGSRLGGAEQTSAGATGVADYVARGSQIPRRTSDGPDLEDLKRGNTPTHPPATDAGLKCLSSTFQPQPRPGRWSCPNAFENSCRKPKKILRSPRPKPQRSVRLRRH